MLMLGADPTRAVRATRRLGRRRGVTSASTSQPLDHDASRDACRRAAQEARRSPRGAARTRHRRRRGQPLLHGGAGQDAGRPRAPSRRAASAGRCDPDKLRRHPRAADRSPACCRRGSTACRRAEKLRAAAGQRSSARCSGTRRLAALDAQAAAPARAGASASCRRAAARRASRAVREYAFQHQILHQVTYATVLKRTAARIPRQVAAWLAGLPVLGRATFSAPRRSTSSWPATRAKACAFYARAAEHAAGRLRTRRR